MKTLELLFSFFLCQLFWLDELTWNMTVGWLHYKAGGVEWYLDTAVLIRPLDK